MELHLILAHSVLEIELVQNTLSEYFHVDVAIGRLESLCKGWLDHKSLDPRLHVILYQPFNQLLIILLFHQLLQDLVLKEVANTLHLFRKLSEVPSLSIDLFSDIVARLLDQLTILVERLTVLSNSIQLNEGCWMALDTADLVVDLGCGLLLGNIATQGTLNMGLKQFR